jgi:hypothetical protein
LRLKVRHIAPVLKSASLASRRQERLQRHSQTRLYPVVAGTPVLEAVLAQDLIAAPAAG